jgi:hypothetical protein
MKCETLYDPNKLSALNTHFETVVETNKQARKSQTMEDSPPRNKPNRPILIDSRNPSFFDMDGMLPHRKNTVQFGEGSFVQSHRNSMIKPNGSTGGNRLSLSQQRQSYIKKVRNSMVVRKDSVFYILDEDKIFDDERFKTSVEWVKSLQKEKKPLKLNNTDSNFRYIYKTNHAGLKRITEAKKMKNLDLDRYQRNLINNIGDYLSKESIRKLETKMQCVKVLAGRVKKEEAIESLYTQIAGENEVTLKVLQESVDRLNYIREVVKIGGEKLPIIKNMK